MKTLKRSFLYLFAASLLIGCSNKPTVVADFTVVPLPQSISETGAGQFILKGSTKIVYPQGNEAQKQNAAFLAEYLQLSTGLNLSVTDESVAENAIVLKADYQADKPESYNLVVTANTITINGSDDAGTFYGIQTLRKSIPANSTENTIAFPQVDIKDYPRFGYRGSMLDVGRHLFPTEFIKKYIDLLALHNINRFHWSLTQDQGWRIEIKKYPELTKVGSQRDETVIGHNSGKFDGKPYGGFYTQDQVKEIVEYAKKRYITIIPEINHPGHMLAALATYPNLGCTGGPYKVEGQWGVFDDVLCPGNEEIYTFLEDVYSEILELFPSEFIHVGGDECPKVRWKTCPKCQAKIKQLGLKDDAKHSKEEKLQSYVISRTEKFLNSKGRQIIGWDEILEGGLAPNATVMSWRGMEGGIEAAKQKNNVIMTPNSHMYFDYYQAKDIENEPIANGGYISVEKVYGFEPVPSSLSEEEKKYVVGVQANLWTEYIPTSEQVEYMLLPRMGALAEVQWTMPEKKDYENFLPRLTHLMDQYKELGYNYATHLSDVADKVVIDTDKGVISVTLFTNDNAPVYYTLDGTEPTGSSTLYSEPIEVNSTTTIKAVAIREDGVSKVYSNSFDFNKATLKKIDLQSETHRAYTYEGPVILVNGKRGGNSFSNGQWLGFHNRDFVATVDLNELTDVSKVVLGTHHGANSWIFGATGYTVSLSEDGKNFKQVFTEKYPVLTKDSPNGVVDLVASFDTQKARYVKVVANNTKTIPAWHDGKGSPAFLFIDEIIIE